MLDDREQSVLELLVREYIKTAEPISSEKIARRVRNVSSATIRNIFSNLTEEDYIEQPHVSGGRIPRPRAYRFLVDRITGQEETSTPLQKLTHPERSRTVQEEIARRFRVVSCFGELMPFGFREMFEEPEFAGQDLVKEFGRFLDGFEEFRDDYARSIAPDSFRVLIGEENTIQPARHISIIFGKGEEYGFFFIAGPMRMHYEEIIPIVKIRQKTVNRMI